MYFFLDHLSLYIYILISIVLATVMLFIPFLILSHNLDNEKISAYECGFIPFSDARIQFEIKFYFIGVSFVLFDIEFSYLFPWIVNFNNLGLYNFLIMHLFLILLTLGFVFEWLNGVFDW